MPDVETRTIVVDVDDTILTHVDRDYENAWPHEGIIAKINKLYDAGWDIVLFTSRGMISCDGDMIKIERERRPVLEDWLKRHNVKYTRLQFGKPIGVYYVDDKALRPLEFFQMEFDVIKGGSGASVERMGDRLIKKAKNAKDQYEWYKYFQNTLTSITVDSGTTFYTPKVNTFYGDTLDMEYVDGMSGNDYVNDKDHLISDLIGLTESLCEYQFSGPDWSTMVARVEDHLKGERLNSVLEEVFLLQELKRVEQYMNEHKSFMHGDLTLENVIVTCYANEPNVFLIDPNRPEGVYSSWLLDLGKIYQSLLGYEEGFVQTERKAELAEWFRYRMDDEFDVILLMTIVHLVRMLKYKDKEFKQVVRNVISEQLKFYEALVLAPDVAKMYEKLKSEAAQ